MNTNLEDRSQVVPIDIEQRISNPSFVSLDFKELDEKVKSMMEKSQNRIKGGLKFANICKVCGKEGAHRSQSSGGSVASLQCLWKSVLVQSHVEKTQL